MIVLNRQKNFCFQDNISLRPVGLLAFCFSAHRRVYETRMPFGNVVPQTSQVYYSSESIPLRPVGLLASCFSVHRRVYETRMPFGGVRRLVKLTFTIIFRDYKFINTTFYSSLHSIFENAFPLFFIKYYIIKNRKILYNNTEYCTIQESYITK